MSRSSPALSDWCLRELLSFAVFAITRDLYMFAIIASANFEVLSSSAPVMSRAKS
jgi:hypothetical protein